MGRDKIEDDMRKRHDPDLSEDAWNKRIEFEKCPIFNITNGDIIFFYLMKFFKILLKILKISNSN